MATKQKIRLSPEKPIVREYEIIGTQDLVQDGINLTICKYVKPKKVGDGWEDVVLKEWVENNNQYDLKGSKIRVETSIVQ